jgi:DAK2 domain fusion protein YloV
MGGVPAVTDTNLIRFRAAVAGALEHLESRRQEVNDLNVFPVADGDTGDNMVLTLRAVLSELDRLQGADASRTIDEIGRDEIVQSVARAALLGARGNSGVILSQLIRGAAEELVSRPGELIDATLIGAALANAADRAYTSVREPAEGTILTVAREMARQIASDVAHSAEGTRLGPATEAKAQDLAIAQTLEQAVSAGQESVKRGPELLPALREAGVVDAGGYGLTVLFAGVVAALRGEDPPQLDHYEPARIHHPEHHSSTHRFCTNFAVTGHELAPASFIAALEQLGDSVLVVGDSRTLKVHLHTDEPERATAVFAGVGEVSHLDVADMRLQVAERSQRLDAGSSSANGHGGRGPGGGQGQEGGSDGALGQRGELEGSPGGRPHAQARCGAIAVVSGAGLAQMFGELGVRTIDGGPTLNPSTYELLAAIHEVEAEEVVVLPNSTNVIMAAERAAELSDKQVVVVRATSQQAGLAAAVALAPERSVEENAWALQQALEHLRSGAVAPAARADTLGRFQPGDAVGFVEEEMVAWGEPAETLRMVLHALARGVGDGAADGAGDAGAGDADGAGGADGANGTQPAELISVLAGAEAPLALSAVERLLEGEVQAELELRDGGQPAYWWLLAAE